MAERYLARRRELQPIAFHWRRLTPPRGGASIRALVPLYPPVGQPDVNGLRSNRLT